MAKLVATRPVARELRGVRVVVDARPIQEPERSPLTAEYLERLLTAFAREPLEGESFVVISRAMRADPTEELALAGLPVTAHRTLPPTSRVFRSAGLTLDSFLLRGAEFATAVGSGREVGAVFHTAGGAVPLASRLPVVATLLDLAPWELPESYASSPAARFGHRLRARVLHDAARVIVCSRATAESARRRLHLPAERLAIVPLAVDETFRAAGAEPDRVAAVRSRHSLSDRYLCFSGRYDARKDMKTLFQAVRSLRDRHMSEADRGNGRVPVEPTTRSTLPRIVFAIQPDQSDDADLIRQAVDRAGIGDLCQVVITADTAERAAIIAGAHVFIYPALSEATGLPVLEAMSLGIPVICSRAGALPEVVGSAGIVVAQQDVPRLAAAIEALWDGGPLGDQLRRQARRRGDAMTRTWSDVARETREVYAEAAFGAPAT